jgi:hypothetical protein
MSRKTSRRISLGFMWANLAFIPFNLLIGSYVMVGLNIMAAISSYATRDL